jgi:hypothetical protein
MLREEPSVTDMLTFSTKNRMVTITQLIKFSLKKTNKKASESLLPPTLTYLSLLLWDMSWDMHRPIQTHLLCGKHSSEILPMEHKLLLINSWFQVKQSGMLRMVLFYYCLMDMMDKVQNIHPAEQRDSLFSVIKMSSSQKTVIMITSKS